MDSPSSPCPPTTVRRNPPRRAKQTTYAEALPPASLPQDASRPADADNLKVFLRIRPIEVAPPRPGRITPKAGTRALAKGAPPKMERRRTGACLAVNGPSSVTLSVPSLLDRGRAKSEVYDGFSFVFPPDSTQVMVSNIAEAENALALAMLKRSTAATSKVRRTGPYQHTEIWLVWAVRIPVNHQTGTYRPYRVVQGSTENLA
ncbi:hypothetical protein B296_00001208 [Ensete ventricosum]|uniref:Kinesin motor domain-containing protein n=1 Tax=Ensete ventricosum TaxID=4639 RepID=A0A427AUV2_ENSVE|nr:hypothetical protein B296_00001208 [Ensete ventricosum]